MSSGASAIKEREGGVRITLRVKPRASRTKVLGFREGALEVAVAAPPVEGAANEEVRTVIARSLGLPKSAVEIVTGATGKNKVVEASGIDRATAERRLQGEAK